MDWSSRFDRLLARRAPIASGPATPCEGGLGLLPFQASAPLTLPRPVVPEPGSWRGAEQAWRRLRPHRVGHELRAPHRHAWLVSACWGAEEQRRRALASLDAWLAVDSPGRGVGWVHTTDLTARLCHWAASLPSFGPALGWRGLHARLAGSARWHLDHLELRLCSPTPGDPRRSLQLIGIAVGALCFPALPEASSRLGRALSALPGALEALLEPDGRPSGGDLSVLSELQGFGLLLATLGQANRAPMPRAAIDRLRASSPWAEVPSELSRCLLELGPHPRSCAIRFGFPSP
jgi:hypothetical protein